VFLLLGVTGAVVGVAAGFIERTRLAALAMATGCIAPLAIVIWIASLRPGALS
jgi:hypothetical protein